MRHLSRFLGDRVVLVLFGLCVLAMLAAAAWAPVYIWSAEEKGPAMVALFLGLFLGCNGGVIIAGILAAAARQDACEDAYLRGLDRGKKLGRDSLWCAMEGDMRRRVVQDVIANDTAATGADRPAA